MIENLRPVEALYLLAKAKQEEWSEVNALAASLVYLSVEGFITHEKKKFILTEKGKQAVNGLISLREYETKILRCIGKKNEEGLLDAVNCFDFKKYFLEQGIFCKEPGQKLIFKYTKTVPTEKFYGMVKELEILKRDIDAAVERREPLGKYFLAMTYAFPSLSLSDGFKEYAKNVSEAVDASETVNMLTMITLINMMNTMTIISTTNTTMH